MDNNIDAKEARRLYDDFHSRIDENKMNKLLAEIKIKASKGENIIIESSLNNAEVTKLKSLGFDVSYEIFNERSIRW